MRRIDSLSDPIQGGAAITPADSDFAGNVQYRCLYVGVSGNVRVTTVDGSDLTYANAAVGFLPVSVKRVWSTGTTATNILGQN